MIDFLLLAIVSIALGFVLGALTSALANDALDSSLYLIDFFWWLLVAPLLLPFTYFVFLEGHYGRSLGKLAVGLRVVRSEDNSPIGYGEAIRRHLTRMISVLPFLLGYLWMVLDRERRTWHDRLSDTKVVRGTPPILKPSTMPVEGPHTDEASGSRDQPRQPDETPLVPLANPQEVLELAKYFQARGRWAEAARMWDTMIWAFPDEKAYRLDFAFCCYKGKWFQDTLEAANAVLVRDSNNADAHSLRGVALFGLGEKDAGLADAQEGVRLAKGTSRPSAILARILYENGNRPESWSMVEEGLARDADNVEYLFCLAYFAEGAKEFALMEKYLLRLDALIPSHPETRAALGRAKVLQKKKAEAVPYLLDALRLEPQDEIAQAIIHESNRKASFSNRRGARVISVALTVSLLYLVLLVSFVAIGVGDTPALIAAISLAVTLTGGFLLWKFRLRKALGSEATEWIDYVLSVRRQAQMPKKGLGAPRKVIPLDPPRSSVLSNLTVCRCSEVTALYGGAAVGYARLHLGHVRHLLAGAGEFVCPQTRAQWIGFDGGPGGGSLVKVELAQDKSPESDRGRGFYL